MRKLPLFLASLLAIPSLCAPAQEVVKGKKKTIVIVWEHHETKNYHIAYEKVIPLSTVKKVARELEDILEQYVKIFRQKREKKYGKLQVKFLESQNTYEQEGGDLRHPAHYNAGSKHLVLKQLPFYELVPTAYHEAFHQYLHMYVGDGVPIPSWFNEGMAYYFEGMKRDEKTRAKKLNPKLVDNRKMRMVQSAIRTRTHIPLAKLIDAPYEEFHDPDKESLHYTQSFALAYFFMQAGNRPAYDFMRELKATKDVEAANAKLFGKDRKRLKSLEAQWKKYVVNVSLPIAKR